MTDPRVIDMIEATRRSFIGLEESYAKHSEVMDRHVEYIGDPDVSTREDWKALLPELANLRRRLAVFHSALGRLEKHIKRE